MAEVTLEQIKEALKQTGITADLNIKDLAKIAKAVNDGTIEQMSKEKDSKISVGTTWKIALRNYPDFAIKRTTPKTEQLLVIMPSCKGYYIKSKKGGEEIVDELNEDLYVKFTAGMPDINLNDDLKEDEEPLWINKLISGKRFYNMFKVALRNDTYIEMIKYRCAKKYEYLSYNWGKTSIDNDTSLAIYKKCPVLYKEFYNDEIAKERFFSSSGRVIEILVEKFGLNNVRDFINENKISLIDGERGYNASGVYTSYSFDQLMRDNEFHYEEFKDYVLYQSVQMGYGKSMGSFWNQWADTLGMQRRIYGKVKVKYPKDLPLIHQQLSYKQILNAAQIDARMLSETIARLSKYDMTIGKYIFMCPKSKDDMTDEATQQANCLAGYIDRYVNGSSDIFFMRKKDDPETSYITIEKRGNDLAQIYYAHNKHVSDDDHKVAERWLKICAKIDKGEKLPDENVLPEAIQHKDREGEDQAAS